ncbi:putative DUF1479 domain protein [Seiridium unicorne]|uniref:DUF1479 domain protein n=1 Tax=Seiridium unicorne TaxID=138068 RepID=A0ABR2VI80_9PEZI
MSPGRLEEWPLWPEFTAPEAPPKNHEELLSYKKAITEKYGEAAIRKGWLEVCKELATATDEIAEKGTAIIPEISFEDFCDLSTEARTKMQTVGCFVIRGVIPTEEANAHFHDLNRLVTDNRDKITGWPEAKPAILRLYWSPTQMAIRSHPNHMRVQKELNSWWEDDSGSTSPEPLVYADAVRIRPPGLPLDGLCPHIDAGNLCRWADTGYVNVYDAIFSGEPQKHKMYDLTRRKDANQALFHEGTHQSSVFRAFQGWTALTRAGAGEGSLLLYPSPKLAIAYLLLRPFFMPPSQPNDIMDAAKWKFDAEQSWFPGSSKSGSQLLSDSSHPHLRLKDCLVTIPTMTPGDTIWWHCDMVHAVELEHRGAHDSSVAYIAATPTTPANVRYVKQQLKDFLAGEPLEDFKAGINEKTLKGYVGESVIADDAGRRAMGFGL